MALLSNHLAGMQHVAREHLAGRFPLDDAAKALARAFESMLDDQRLAADPIDLEIRSIPLLLSRIPSAARGLPTDEIFAPVRSGLSGEDLHRLETLLSSAFNELQKLRGPTA